MLSIDFRDAAYDLTEALMDATTSQNDSALHFALMDRQERAVKALQVRVKFLHKQGSKLEYVCQSDHSDEEKPSLSCRPIGLPCT